MKYEAISDPYERPIENVEYDERHGEHYPAALVDPLRDLLRRHRREIVQFGESRSARKRLGWRGAVDGRDTADRAVRILVLFYSHRRNVDCAWKALESVIILRREQLHKLVLVSSACSA